jgi:hypothetical protein
VGWPGGGWDEVRSVEWARRAWGNRTVYGGGRNEVKEVKEVQEGKEKSYWLVERVGEFH